MRVAYTGATSKLGEYLFQRGYTPLDLDITDVDSIRTGLEKCDADIIVNLAGKSNVDWCERSINHKEAFACNVKGAFYLAQEADFFDKQVVLLSSDHIFDGKRGPYSESYSKIKPVNYYGMTKFAMEGHHCENTKIIRTSYLFDDARMQYDVYSTKEYVSYYSTKVKRSFMHFEHFVNVLDWYIDRYYRMPKVLHISGSKTVSWYKFMQEIARAYEIDLSNVKPERKYEEIEGKAHRPQKGGLKTDLSAKIGLPQYSYLDGIRWMVEK